MKTAGRRWIVVSIAMGFLWVGCSTIGPQNRRDQESLERVEKYRQQAKASQGDARAAIDYARAILTAVAQDVYSRQEGSPDQRVEEASKLLLKAAEVQTTDAPMVLAWRGNLFCAIEQLERCITAMQKSMRAEPNTMAANALIAWHNSRNRYDGVRKVCRRTLPHVDGEDARYDFISKCIDNSGAAEIEGGLSWAPAEQQRWYLNERQRRKREKARRELAERRAEEMRERKAKYCVADCKEEGHLCMKDCYSDQCERSCNQAYRACLDKCEAEIGE